MGRGLSRSAMRKFIPGISERPRIHAPNLYMLADVQRMGDRYTVSGGRPRFLSIAAHSGQPRKERLGKHTLILARYTLANRPAGIAIVTVPRRFS